MKTLFLQPFKNKYINEEAFLSCARSPVHKVNF